MTVYGSPPLSLVALDKPADRQFQHCLPYTGYLTHCHQLDFATSGLICFARTPETARCVQALFAQRRVRKEYLAVVLGHVTENMLIDFPIIPEKSQFRQRVGATGRTAISLVTVLERGFYNESPCSLVLVRPITGRRHQIRIHLAEMGFPILGDVTYAGPNDEDRMYLHAYRLEMNLEAVLTLWTEMPASFQHLFPETEMVQDDTWQWALRVLTGNYRFVCFIPYVESTVYLTHETRIDYTTARHLKGTEFRPRLSKRKEGEADNVESALKAYSSDLNLKNRIHAMRRLRIGWSGTFAVHVLQNDILMLFAPFDSERHSIWTPSPATTLSPLHPCITDCITAMQSHSSHPGWSSSNFISLRSPN